MEIAPQVRLGPLSQVVARDARWDDPYPAWQSYADELEKLCEFLVQARQFERYLPRLRGRKKERNSALNEIRLAWHFQSADVPIISWEPRGQDECAGEFLLGLQSGQRIFVEVKGPTWEAELSQDERLAGRIRGPKYINGEGRAFDNSEWIRFAIDKAYPKFDSGSPNLVIIADDLFVSLQHGTDMFAGKALYEARYGAYFSNKGYERLGGAGVFWTNSADSGVLYDLRLYINTYALESCRLPDLFVRDFGGQAVS